MEVKPVGRERDRQIEKLRLLETTYFLKGDTGPIPHYSTSLTDAWELWEEMKGATTGYIRMMALPKDRVEIDFVNDKTLVNTLFTGKSETDAISGAWVMWKGSNG